MLPMEDNYKNKYLKYKDILEDYLLNYIPPIDDKSKTLKDAMEYSLTAGGKRIRPVLLMASCEFAGGDYKDALPYACALEYIHTYSLIHDDLPAMDNDDLRRGKPTNHIVYGEGNAILAGDGLLNSAFEIMSKDLMMYFDKPKAMVNRIKAMHIIAKSAGVQGMIAGQITDLESEDFSPDSIDGDVLNYIHINKTAALIQGAIKAGITLGGGEEKMVHDFSKYGENLGLAFQIADDILDIKGRSEDLGKMPGSDRENNKLTYVSLYGPDHAEKELKRLSESAVTALETYDNKADFFRQMVIALAERKS